MALKQNNDRITVSAGEKAHIMIANYATFGCSIVTLYSLAVAVKNRETRLKALYRPVWMIGLTSLTALWFSNQLWKSHNKNVGHLSYDELEDIAYDRK